MFISMFKFKFMFTRFNFVSNLFFLIIFLSDGFNRFKLKTYWRRYHHDLLAVFLHTHNICNAMKRKIPIYRSRYQWICKRKALCKWQFVYLWLLRLQLCYWIYWGQLRNRYVSREFLDKNRLASPIIIFFIISLTTFTITYFMILK